MPTFRDQPIEVYRFDSVESTNMHARREVESGATIATPRLYVAGIQTNGRGQHGRSWVSPAGGLWCTFVVPWRPPWARGELEGSAACVAALGVRLGLACASTIHEVVRAERASVAISLKLPNDVLVHSRKVLGILTEIVRGGTSREAATAHATPFLLVGVGINANFPTKDLPPAIEPIATTLRAVTGREIDLNQLLRVLSGMVLPAMDTSPLSASELVAVRACLHGRGRPTRVISAAGLLIEGKLEGVDASGAVEVSTPSGLVTGALAPRLEH